MKTILVGVDSSEPSFKAARWAAELAQKMGSKVVLLFALEPLTPLTSLRHPKTGGEVHAREGLIQLLDELGSMLPSVQLEKRVVDGPAADVLLAEAEKTKADLIVVGARGLGAGTRWLMGSVSDKVMHYAPCPVAVVR